eukprot:scaffold234667_cov30-Tisochrysis_lutea.AAC.2
MGEGTFESRGSCRQVWKELLNTRGKRTCRWLTNPLHRGNLAKSMFAKAIASFAATSRTRGDSSKGMAFGLVDCQVGRQQTARVQRIYAGTNAC